MKREAHLTPAPSPRLFAGRDQTWISQKTKSGKFTNTGLRICNSAPSLQVGMCVAQHACRQPGLPCFFCKPTCKDGTRATFCPSARKKKKERKPRRDNNLCISWGPISLAGKLKHNILGWSWSYRFAEFIFWKSCPEQVYSFSWSLKVLFLVGCLKPEIFSTKWENVRCWMTY